MKPYINIIMPCNFDCDPEDCLLCLGTAIETEIFTLIQSTEDGETDEQWYQEQLKDCRYDEVSNHVFVLNMSEGACERHIYEYGIQKALDLYEWKFGESSVYDLLCDVVNDLLCVTYTDYKNWCESHPLDDE